MAVAVNIPTNTTVSPVDALWTLIMAQKKSVQKALAERLNASIKAEKEAKVKMTEKEFYAKLDESIASTASGPVYTMQANESGDDFINRILAESR